MFGGFNTVWQFCVSGKLITLLKRLDTGTRQRCQFMPKRDPVACHDSISKWRGADGEVCCVSILVIQRSRLGGGRSTDSRSHGRFTFKAIRRDPLQPDFISWLATDLSDHPNCITFSDESCCR